MAIVNSAAVNIGLPISTNLPYALEGDTISVFKVVCSIDILEKISGIKASRALIPRYTEMPENV